MTKESSDMQFSLKLTESYMIIIKKKTGQKSVLTFLTCPSSSSSSISIPQQPIQYGRVSGGGCTIM